MKFLFSIRCILCSVIGLVVVIAPAPTVWAQTFPQLQQQYVDQGQGMFLHFNMSTFVSGPGDVNGQWADPGTSINTFNPTALDTDQWAATAKSAGMKFGVLTAKHHNGFALWDTALSNHDVASTNWHTGQAARTGDVVKRYADSFRNQGLGVGLYFSIWDRKAGVDNNVSQINNGVVNNKPIADYVKEQLTELLGTPGNRPYGQIEALWFDAYGWRVDYSTLPYNVIRDHVRAISPNTIIINNDHRESYNTTDIISFEQSFNPNAPLPYSYVERSWTIANDGTWFWNPPGTSTSQTKPVAKLADDINAMRANGGVTLLNLGPDATGRMHANYVTAATLLGKAVSEDNLAKNKATSQSSTWPGNSANFTADRAVDGLFNTSNGVMAHTNFQANPWWRVDLGQTQNIGEVVLFNRDQLQERLSDLIIEILDSNQQVVFSSPLINPNDVLDGPEGIIVPIEVAGVPGVNGQFVRITRQTDNGALTLGEVLVFASAPEPASLVLLSLGGLVLLRRQRCAA